MTSVLEELYYGNVNPSDRPAVHNAQLDEADLRIEKEYQYFSSKLSEEDNARFRELESLYAEVFSYSEVDAFCCGIRLGVSLMWEILAPAYSALKV